MRFWRKKECIPCEIKRHIIYQLHSEMYELHTGNDLLYETALEICAKWVAPDMYGSAMNEIEKMFEE